MSCRLAVAAIALSLSASAYGQESADGEPAADVKQQCAAAYEQAQVLKLDNRLIQAREQMLACMAEPCPQVAKSHCAEWLVEVERAIPTVVLSFVDAAGTNRDDVAVSVDGRPLTNRLDGQAVTVDPGPHTFVFTPGGGGPVERRVTVAEGERNVKVAVSLAPPEQPAPQPPGGDATPSQDDGFPVLPMVLGGLSLVGFGLFAGFGASALVTGNKCKPTCSDEQVDDVTVKALVADISLGVGVLAFAGAVVSFVVLSDDADSAAVSRWRVAASPVADGGVVSVGGSF